MKQIREQIDISLFLNIISEQCGDVYYISREGDQLNLKSELCKYIFAIVYSKQELLLNGELLCSKSEDYETLKDFWMEVSP